MSVGGATIGRVDLTALLRRLLSSLGTTVAVRKFLILFHFMFFF